MRTFSLEKYNIFVGEIKTMLQHFPTQHYSQVVVLCDENTEAFCLPIFLQSIDNQKINVVKIESGEHHKNLLTCEKIWTSLMDLQIDRKALVMNLGGGVIGDMGGFCASTFKRGFDFVQIPTTLLSQVDASIGGKLGVDFKGIKNSIGVFQDPKAVFIDVAFLKTLSERELRSGFAEIIKHALIADKKQWTELLGISDLQKVDWETVVSTSLQVKKEIVLKDPFEKNVRKALNFGHTVGHAVESYFLETENPLLHGEAVAIGMICEAYLSMKKGLLSATELTEISDFILKVYQKIDIPTHIYDALFVTMRQDKKNEFDTINFTLLDSIGAFQINHSIDDAIIKESLDFYNSL